MFDSKRNHLKKRKSYGQSKSKVRPKKDLVFEIVEGCRIAKGANREQRRQKSFRMVGLETPYPSRKEAGTSQS